LAKARGNWFGLQNQYDYDEYNRPAGLPPGPWEAEDTEMFSPRDAPVLATIASPALRFAPDAFLF